MKSILQTSIIAFATLVSVSVSTQAQTAYTIGNNGNQLVKFDLSTPGTIASVLPVTGAVTNLAGIDFRPADGLLYGFDNTTGGRIVTINVATGVTTLVSTSSTNSTTGNMGVDFNPVADRLRVVNEVDQNLRINVATGATTVDGNLAYDAGDPNSAANPSIIDAAYTNSFAGAGTTSLFYIDNSLDTLVRTINPNAGSLLTVGPLGFGTNNRTGFDILSDGIGGNSAYALLTATSGVASLYTINLASGAATPVGAIGGAAVRPYGLAIAPAPAVPEPGTALFGLALFGTTLMRRGKRKAAITA